jgi:hypothetical protein
MIDFKKTVAILLAVLFILFFTLSAFPSSAQVKEESSKPPDLDAKMRAEVVKGVGDLLKNLYIFPDKAKEMDALIAKKLQEGAYDKLVDAQAFARALTGDLRSVSKDRPGRVVATKRGKKKGSGRSWRIERGTSASKSLSSWTETSATSTSGASPGRGKQPKRE